jgi:hypothetical protein
VDTLEIFAMVAHLTRSIERSQMVKRVYLNGRLLETGTANIAGTGDLWGWSLGPLRQAGVWRYEITDAGGNVLAAGSISAQ